MGRVEGEDVSLIVHLLRARVTGVKPGPLIWRGARGTGLAWSPGHWSGVGARATGLAWCPGHWSGVVPGSLFWRGARATGVEPVACAMGTGRQNGEGGTGTRTRRRGVTSPIHPSGSCGRHLQAQVTGVEPGSLE